MRCLFLGEGAWSSAEGMRDLRPFMFVFDGFYQRFSGTGLSHNTVSVCRVVL